MPSPFEFDERADYTVQQRARLDALTQAVGFTYEETEVSSETVISAAEKFYHYIMDGPDA